MNPLERILEAILEATSIQAVHDYAAGWAFHYGSALLNREISHEASADFIFWAVTSAAKARRRELMEVQLYRRPLRR